MQSRKLESSSCAMAEFMTYYGIWRYSRQDGPVRLDIGLRPPSSVLSNVGETVAAFDFVLSGGKSYLINSPVVWKSLSPFTDQWQAEEGQ
jgi:hypothetical protein